MGRAMGVLSVKHIFEQIRVSFVLSDRQTESRSWMNTSTKEGGRRRRRSTRLRVLDQRWLRPEVVWRRVVLACREEQVIVDQMRHGVAKEGRLRRF